MWLLAVVAASSRVVSGPGVVVEAVRSSSPAERAGLRPGDVLLTAWAATAEAPVELRTPWDLEEIEIEQALQDLRSGRFIRDEPRDD